MSTFTTTEAATQAYQDSETENVRLRATLEWLMGKINEAEFVNPCVAPHLILELGKRLEDPATRVVDEHDGLSRYEWAAEAARLVQRVTDFLDRVAQEVPKGMTQRVGDVLVRDATAYAALLRPYGDEPRKPIVLTAREIARRAAKSSALKRKDQ